MKKENLLKKIWRCKTSYLFVLPALILLIVFRYSSFITSIYQSLFQWNGANVHIFIGLGNYIELMQDEKFWTSLLNIAIYMIAVILRNLVFPFIAVELVLNLKGRKREFLKMSFIVPMVVPTMVVILLWRWILGGETGILNMALTKLGLEEWVTPWLGDPSTALGALIAVGFPWIAGLPFLLYLAGKQGISESLYESASLEGAGLLQKIRYIDIPLLASQRKLIITYSVITAFQAFEKPMVLTSGGPGVSTMVPALYLYQKAFNDNEFGYASAIGTVVFLILLVLTLINQKIGKESDGNE